MIESNSERIMIDSYAWFEYFRGSAEGENAKKFIESDALLHTPSIVIAELSDKYRRLGAHSRWKWRKALIKNLSKITNLNIDIADEGGKIKQSLRKSHSNAGLADAIIVAHAKKLDAKILTGDNNLIDRKDVINIKK